MWLQGQTYSLDGAHQDAKSFRAESRQLAPGRPEDAEGPEPGGPEAETHAVPHLYPLNPPALGRAVAGPAVPGLSWCPLLLTAEPSPSRAAASGRPTFA